MTMTSVVNKLLDEMGAFVLPVAAGLFIGGFLLNRMTAVEDSEETEETEGDEEVKEAHVEPATLRKWSERAAEEQSETLRRAAREAAAKRAAEEKRCADERAARVAKATSCPGIAFGQIALGLPHTPRE